MAGRTVKVSIEANVAGAVANLKTFSGAVKEMGSELDRAAAKHPERLNKISNVTGVLGLAAAGAFAMVVKAGMDFDAQMSKVAAVSNDGAESLGKLRDAAIAAGRDTAYTATQAAQAEEELAKAGISAKDILGGGLKGALDLAAAGQMDLADAATIAAQAMTVFGLTGKEVPHIADVLAASANKSAADMHGMGDSLKQGGQIAAQFGLTLEQTVGTLSAFADSALVGSDAGTSLKTMLIALAKPTDQSAALMKQLGINAYDAQGKFVGVVGLAGQLQDKLGGLTDAQRNAALAQIFGTDAMRAASILYKQGATGIEGYIAAVDDSGAASETAAKKLDNLSGDMHKLIGSLQAVAISASGGANAGLRDLAQGAEAALNAFLGLPKPVQEGVVAILGISGAGLLATSGLLKVKATAGEAMTALRDLGPAGEKVAGMLGSIGKWGGIAGLALIAAFGFKELVDFLASKAGPASVDVDKLTDSLKHFAETGQATGEMAKRIGQNLSGFVELANKAADEAKTLDQHEQDRNKKMAGNANTVDAYGAAWAAYGDSVTKAGGSQAQFQVTTKALDASLSQLVTSGGVAQANVLFQDLAKRWVESGHSLDELNKMFPEYNKASRDAAAGTAPLAQGFGDVKQNADLMTQGLQDAIEHGLKLVDVFKQLNGANIDAAHAEDQLFESIDKANQAAKDNGKTMDAHTEKGRANREALLGIAEAADQAAQATYNQTGSLDQAQGILKTARDAFIAAAVAMGMDAKSASALADQWLRMPANVSTTVTTHGADAAAGQAQRVHSELDRLDGTTANTYIHVITIEDLRPGQSGTRGNAAGGVYEHAAVGALRDASLYSPAGPARYAFAEPSTGGEAFIPRRGDMARSRGIADYVVSQWLGGQVSWGGGHGGGSGGGSGGGAMQVELVLTGGDASTQALLGTMRKAVNTRGGNVQLAVMGKS